MNITVTFNSLKELQDFQNNVVIKGTADAQKPAEKAPEKKPEKVTPKAEKPVQTAPAKPEPVAEIPAPEMNPPEEPAPKKAEKKLTATDLKVFAATQAKAGYRAQLKALLTSYGEKSVTDLTEHQPEKMQEFYDKLKEETNAE